MMVFSKVFPNGSDSLFSYYPDNHGKSISFYFASPFYSLESKIGCAVLEAKAIEIGSNPLQFTSIEYIPYPLRVNKLTVETLSPILFNLSDADIGGNIRDGLIDKCISLGIKVKADDCDFKIEVLEDFNSIEKNTFEGVLRLTGSRFLLDTALKTGIGEKNCHGYGMVKILENSEN